jgi:hypothetical protein
MSLNLQYFFSRTVQFKTVFIRGITGIKDSRTKKKYRDAKEDVLKSILKRDKEYIMVYLTSGLKGYQEYKERQRLIWATPYIDPFTEDKKDNTNQSEQTSNNTTEPPLYSVLVMQNATDRFNLWYAKPPTKGFYWIYPHQNGLSPPT